MSGVDLKYTGRLQLWGKKDNYVCSRVLCPTFTIHVCY